MTPRSPVLRPLGPSEGAIWRGGCGRRWGTDDAVLLALAAAVLVTFRLHAFSLPLETDECNYAYIAARLLAGDRLYVDVWDHQPPGTFAPFAAVIALFGDAPEVLRWMSVGFSLASMALLFALGRRVGGRTLATISALLFSLASSDPGTAGEGCNREIHMNTLILLAWFLVLRDSPPSRGAVLAAGLSLGLASTLKTIVAMHWLGLAVWLVASHQSRGRQPTDMHQRRGREPADTRDVGERVTGLAPGALTRLGPALRTLACFAAGPAVVWLVCGAWFAFSDRWSAFLDAVFLFNVSYSASSEGLLARLVHFFRPPHHPFVFESAAPLWIASAASAVYLAWRTFRWRCAVSGGVLVMGISGILAVCAPAHFWPHYYYLLLPPAVLSVAIAAVDVGNLLSNRLPTRKRSGTLLRFVVPVALIGATGWSEFRHYLGQPPFGITVKRYNSRDFWGRAQGLNLGRVTRSDDQVFVFGNEAEIYYYAGRRCASRYTMITGLDPAFSGHEERRRTLLEELRARRPRVILVLFDVPEFDKWVDFLHQEYREPIGWDFHDRNGAPIMFVVDRKDDPVESNGEPVNWNWDRSEVGGWFLDDGE